MPVRLRPFASTSESGDHDETWGTIGVSENIIEASWHALVDAVEYKLHKENLGAHGEIVQEEATAT